MKFDKGDGGAKRKQAELRGMQLFEKCRQNFYYNSQAWKREIREMIFKYRDERKFCGCAKPRKMNSRKFVRTKFFAIRKKTILEKCENFFNCMKSHKMSSRKFVCKTVEADA